MTPEQQIDAMNRNPIGTNVVYWPTLHRAGKRTKTRSAAFLSNSGTPVIFVEGVSGYVHVEHVEIGSLMPTDSPCFDNNFQHLWGLTARVSGPPLSLIGPQFGQSAWNDLFGGRSAAYPQADTPTTHQVFGTNNWRKKMGDTFNDGTTDWHNWMRDTMKIDPSDKRTIEIVWACIVRCQLDFEKKFCSECCAKNTEQDNQPDSGE